MPYTIYMARKTDELDSTITNIGIFVYAVLLTAALFIGDFYFGKTYLTATLVGILIGAPLGWIGSSVTYFFQRKQQNGEKTNGE